MLPATFEIPYIEFQKRTQFYAVTKFCKGKGNSAFVVSFNQNFLNELTNEDNFDARGQFCEFQLICREWVCHQAVFSIKTHDENACDRTKTSRGRLIRFKFGKCESFYSRSFCKIFLSHDVFYFLFLINASLFFQFGSKRGKNTRNISQTLKHCILSIERYLEN